MAKHPSPIRGRTAGFKVPIEITTKRLASLNKTIQLKRIKRETMSQQEILTTIINNPGILQKDLIPRNKVTNKTTGGDTNRMLLKLIQKGCIEREVSGRTYALYATGETL